MNRCVLKLQGFTSVFNAVMRKGYEVSDAIAKYDAQRGGTMVSQLPDADMNLPQEDDEFHTWWKPPGENATYRQALKLLMLFLRRRDDAAVQDVVGNIYVKLCSLYYVKHKILLEITRMRSVITLRECIDVYRREKRTVSVNTPVGNGSDTIKDILPDPRLEQMLSDKVFMWDLEESLDRGLAERKYSPNDVIIWKGVRLEGKKPGEMGRRFGFKSAKVSQRLAKIDEYVVTQFYADMPVKEKPRRPDS